MDEIRPPGKWLDAEMSEQETAEIMKMTAAMGELDDTTEPEAIINKLLPYMNSFMHLMYRLVRSQYGLEATEDGVRYKEKPDVYFNIAKYTADFILYKYDINELLTAETVRATLPRLIGTTPKNYYIPNNKLAKNLTKDAVDGVPLELVVSGQAAKKEVVTRCLLSYEGDKVKLQGERPFTEFKRNIYNGVISLFVDGDESHLMTPAMIYRAANGITDGTDPSPGMKAAISRAVREMGFIFAEIDFTDEAKMYRSDVENCHIRDTILDVRELSVSISGKTHTAFHVKNPPLLYEYAQVSGQIASLPPHLLDIRQVKTDKKGRVLKSSAPGGRISNNDRRMAVKSFLLRSIFDMQHNHKLSRNIIFERMYEEIATESEKTFTEKEMRNIRDYIPQVLNYWIAQDFIKGYEPIKAGNKIRGVTIKI